MKIKKLNQTTTATNTIIEDIHKLDLLAEDTSITTDVEAPATAVVSDPENANLDVIAASIEAGLEAEAAQDGEDIDISAKTATEIAKDVKEVATKIEADVFVPSASDNVLTRILDNVLRSAEAAKEEANILNKRPKSNFNLLVSGLPGSGKTAIVKDWAAAKGVNLVYVDAKNDDLEAFINGFTVRDARQPEKNRVTKGTSDGLADLEKPRSVLFLDELNRQTKRQVRASLLTLINEHSITGDRDNPEDVGGYHYFKNMLFTIACINPALPTERGVDVLDDAESSRFIHKLDFDSNVETAYDFFSKYFDDSVRGFSNKVKRNELTEEFFIKLATKYLLEKALAITIISHPDFTFDTRDDLEEIQNYGAGDKFTLFNLRMLFDGIQAADGDVKTFLNWVDTTANFRPDVRTMLQKILKHYVAPTIDPEELLRTYGLRETEGETADAAKTAEKADAGPGAAASSEDEEDLYSLATTLADIDFDLEADTAMFNNGTAGGKKVAVSPTEARQKIEAWF